MKRYEEIEDQVHDASGVSNPEHLLWYKGPLGIYYPMIPDDYEQQYKQDSGAVYDPLIQHQDQPSCIYCISPILMAILIAMITLFLNLVFQFCTWREYGIFNLVLTAVSLIIKDDNHDAISSQNVSEQ